MKEQIQVGDEVSLSERFNYCGIPTESTRHGTVLELAGANATVRLASFGELLVETHPVSAFKLEKKGKRS